MLIRQDSRVALWLIVLVRAGGMAFAGITQPSPITWYVNNHLGNDAFDGGAPDSAADSWHDQP